MLSLTRLRPAKKYRQQTLFVHWKALTDIRLSFWLTFWTIYQFMVRFFPTD
jgi:hypothetical protein